MKTASSLSRPDGYWHLSIASYPQHKSGSLEFLPVIWDWKKLELEGLLVINWSNPLFYSEDLEMEVTYPKPPRELVPEPVLESLSLNSQSSASFPPCFLCSEVICLNPHSLCTCSKCLLCIDFADLAGFEFHTYHSFIHSFIHPFSIQPHLGEYLLFHIDH